MAKEVGDFSTLEEQHAYLQSKVYSFPIICQLEHNSYGCSLSSFRTRA
jgi:hypothetical protein